MINISMEVNTLQPTNSSATPTTAPSDNVQKETEMAKERVERKETVQPTTSPDAMLGSQIDTYA